MKKILNRILIVLFVTIFLPAILNATVYFEKNENIFGTINSIVNKYNKYEKYLVSNTTIPSFLENGIPFVFENGELRGDSNYINAGLLNREEFIISGGESSYLYNSVTYWTMTNVDSNNTYCVIVGSGCVSKLNSETSTIKVTEYIQPDTAFIGSGRFSDPWMFKNKYTVNISSNNLSYGDVEPKSINVAYNDDIAVRLLPKDGYIYDSDTCGGVSSENFVNINDITAELTCVISFKPAQYLITYNSDGGTACSNKSVTYNAQYGELCVPIKTGYTFSGWYNSAGALVSASTTVSTAANHTLTAHWTANTYTLTYDSNGGSACSNKTVTYNAQYGELCVPIKTGYTFSGWYNSAGALASASTAVSTAANHTLTAHWTASTYTLTYDSNGGSACASKTVTYNAQYGTLCGPTRSGYIFNGWYNSAGALVSASTTVSTAANHTLTARWTANNVTVTLNGGCNETITYTGTSSGSVVLNNNCHNSVTIPVGTYTFTGSYSGSGTAVTQAVTANCTINVYPAGAVFWYGNGDESGESLYSVTGGFTDSNYVPSGVTGSSGGYQAGPNGNGLDHRVYTESQYQNGYHVTAFTKNAISMTGYSTLNVEHMGFYECNDGQHYNGWYDFKLYLTSNVANNFSFSKSYDLTKDGSSFSVLSVSASGSFHVAFNIHPYFCIRGGSSMNVRKIWRS